MKIKRNEKKIEKKGGINNFKYQVKTYIIFVVIICYIKSCV